MYRECVWMSTNAVLNWSFCIVLYHTVFNIILYCTIQYCTVLYCAVLYCIRLWCIDVYSPFRRRYFSMCTVYLVVMVIVQLIGCHGDCTVDWLSRRLYS